MSKPFSEFDLSTQLVEDRIWRLREISDLRAAITKSDNIARSVLLRALVTICYAHWEGYVRFAARKYLEHIALRKFEYSQLDRQFIRNYFLPRLSALSASKTSLSERCELVDNILDASNRRFSRVNEDLVNTQANLNYAVFSDICLICGIDSDKYGAKETFIDVLLLKRRNAIAHGEDTFIRMDDMTLITDTTIELMRNFGDELDNQATLKTYKAAA